jgi:nitrate reductase gamma subunit
MFELIRGPLLWIGFIGLFGGLIYRFVTMARLAKRERVVLPTFSVRYGLRSLAHWLVPFGGANMRRHPAYTLLSWAFHIGVVVTPLFVMGHAVLWREAWGFRWWSLPEGVADVMSLVVIGACLFFILRRLLRPEVRNVSYPSDFVLALVVMAPFLTGFIAHRQWLPYQPMIIIHGLSGVLGLLVIPWTRLVHMLWFVFTRAFMGSEFGAVRHSRDW